MKLSRSLMAAAAGLVAVGGAVAPAAADNHGEDATYEVTVRNLTRGQYLTPLVWAGHDRSHELFDFRGHATPGLQAMAENGDVPGFASEATAALGDNGDVGVGGDAPWGPGESITFTVQTDEEWLSLAGMVICTNDGFGGADTRRLPTKVGQRRAWRLVGYDAGTEVNTEQRGDLVPAPFCGDGDGATASNPALAEDGRIRFHKGITGIGDLDSSFDWRRVVGKVFIKRVS